MVDLALSAGGSREGEAEPDAPSAGEVTPAPSRLDRILSVAGGTITVAGILTLLFVAYLVVFTTLQGNLAQRRLVSHFRPGSVALTGGVPAVGQPVAILEIAALGLRQAVVEGTGVSQLDAGPGLVVGSAYPGTAGNTVIAGRRLTYGHPFLHLDKLRSGDRIQVINAYGTATYQVNTVETVLPGEVDPASPSRAAKLTLVTSNPPLLPTDRLAVVATLIGKPLQLRGVSAAEPVSSLDLSGDSGDWPAAALWGALLVAAVTGALVLRRRTPYRPVLYMLATPVILALAVGCFENLSRLLPATL